MYPKNREMMGTVYAVGAQLKKSFKKLLQSALSEKMGTY